jgi:hypothetical protein
MCLPLELARSPRRSRSDAEDLTWLEQNARGKRRQMRIGGDSSAQLLAGCIKPAESEGA